MARDPEWYVMPQCRSAHFCTDDTTGRRTAYHTACDILYDVGYVDYNPNAQRCKPCVRALQKQGKDVAFGVVDAIESKRDGT
jgi:hypothetical protein